MTDKKKETFEYRAMRDLALEQLRSGKSSLPPRFRSRGL